jgi:hypothetical protein
MGVSGFFIFYFFRFCDVARVTNIHKLHSQIWLLKIILKIIIYTHTYIHTYLHTSPMYRNLDFLTLKFLVLDFFLND